MNDMDEEDLTEVNSDEEITTESQLEGTGDDPHDFGQTPTEAQKPVTQLPKAETPASGNTAIEVPKPVSTEPLKADTPASSNNAELIALIQTIQAKMEELSRAQQGLIEATNNVNKAFNRESEDMKQYEIRKKEFFESFERNTEEFYDGLDLKLEKQMQGVADEYKERFKKIIAVGNDNMKGFTQAQNLWYKKMAKPITSQSRAIYYLSILNFLMLIAAFSLKFLKYW